jgi:carboxylesterase type B
MALMVAYVFTGLTNLRIELPEPETIFQTTDLVRRCRNCNLLFSHNFEDARMAYTSAYLVVIILLHNTYPCVGDENPVVKTKYGQVKGVTKSLDEGIVHQFRAIPFAQPPVGPLRFRKPKPIDSSWVGKLDATEYGPSCMQPPEFIQVFESLDVLPNLDVSEDCLQLNVYAPRDLDSSRSRSVMVWVHGGGYIMGQASFYDISKLALGGDVIVVTINYRLGAIGFLSTGDAAMPGNIGLWDQRLAIQWTKDNIVFFGGNPNSMTIFGESA